MLPRMLSLWVATLNLAAVQGLFVQDSGQFPLGSEVENLALRPSGSALATVYTFPHVYEVAVAANATPRLVHTFQHTVGACGISESSTPDVYFILTGNFSFQTAKPTPGSYAIHRLSFDEFDRPVVKELAPLVEIAQPNGMTTVPGTPYVLIADSVGGLVYRFDTEKLRLTTYFDNPLLKPVPSGGVTVGVNGVHLSRGHLYFSNTQQELIARIKASGTEPCLEGNPEIVATETPVDDFIVNDISGDVYMAEQGSLNALGFVAGDMYGSQPKTIVGGPNSTATLGPTAAIWAKGAVGRTLLVSVYGDVEQFVTKNYTGGGEIVFVHLDRP